MDEWRPIVSVDEPKASAGSPLGTSRLAEWIRHGRELIGWIGAARIFTALVTLPLVGLGAYMLLRPAPAPIETSIDYASTVPKTDELAVGQERSDRQEVVVHVAGHVNSPGVYVLDLGQRIVDAIRAAGGAQPIADLNSINLALTLGDGDQIYVPAIGESPMTSAQGRVGSPVGDDSNVFPININTASASTLEELPGVGPSTAAAIIGYREKVGAFASPSGLLDVPGIGATKFEALKNLVTT